MSAFEALYERYAAHVFRIALYLSGNRGQAEDITSETFARAWISSDRIRVGTVKAYLFAIARNLFRMQRRRQFREGRLPAECLRDRGPGPDAIVGSRLELERVLIALQQLPESDRAAILMRGQDAMPYEVIAAVLQMSVGAAKVKVHRARLKLEALLGKEGS